MRSTWYRSLLLLPQKAWLQMHLVCIPRANVVLAFWPLLLGFVNTIEFILSTMHQLSDYHKMNKNICSIHLPYKSHLKCTAAPWLEVRFCLVEISLCVRPGCSILPACLAQQRRARSWASYLTGGGIIRFESVWNLPSDDPSCLWFPEDVFLFYS